LLYKLGGYSSIAYEHRILLLTKLPAAQRPGLQLVVAASYEDPTPKTSVACGKGGKKKFEAKLIKRTL